MTLVVERRGKCRLEAQGLLVALDGLRMRVRELQRVAAQQPCPGIAGLQREKRVTGLEGRLDLTSIDERDRQLRLPIWRQWSRWHAAFGRHRAGQTSSRARHRA